MNDQQVANGVEDTAGRDHVSLLMSAASPVGATPCLQLLADVNGSVSGLQGPKFFEAWSRPQLQQLLNMKTGSTGRYATYSKAKLVQRLTQLQAGPKVSQLVSMKLQQSQAPASAPAPAPASVPDASKKTTDAALTVPRKRKNPFPTLAKVSRPRFCANAACRDSLDAEGEYCKRCSCYFCKASYGDEASDLWMKCSRSACRAACHLECALKRKAAGVVRQGSTTQLDGSYACQDCGWLTNLLGSWTKLLATAKTTDRVDIFAARLFSAWRLLDGTLRYRELHGMVVEVAKTLEAEVGPTSDPGSLSGRLVTGLSCGAQLRSLVEAAVGKASSMDQTEKQKVYVIVKGALERAYTIGFEDVTPVSLTITWSGAEAILGEEIESHRIWCRAVEGGIYSDAPVHTIASGGRKASFAGLHPGVEYAFKIVPITRWGVGAGEVEVQRVTAPRARKDWQAILELNRKVVTGELETIKLRSIGKNSTLSFNASSEATAKTSDEKNGRIEAEAPQLPTVNGNGRQDGGVAAGDLSNPEAWKPVLVTVHDTSTSEEGNKSARPETGNEENSEENWSQAELEENFMFSVKVVVWLEKVGLLKTKFRLKLLTWLGVRASMEDIKTFCVLVKTLMTDPNALAAQLIDYLQEILSVSSRVAKKPDV